MSMAETSALESLIRRDRTVVAIGLLSVVALGWLYLLNGAGMDTHEMSGMLMPMAPSSWSPGYFALMLAMWTAMMVAMMLPSAAPMILLYAAAARRRWGQSHVVATTSIFALGYVIIWAGFSVAAVVLQFALHEAAILSPMMTTTSVLAAGAALVAAGIYQWTPLKHACLRRCRSPFEFILVHWREGASGAWQMGLRHGAYCVGCCWVLMLLLFVGGVMNLLWIAGLAVFVLAEKMVPSGHWLGRAGGLLLVAWGGATIFAVV